MLYKVTPALAPTPARRPSSPAGPARKKRRASAVFDGDGHEVLISLMCLKCRQVRPLAQFGLRKMPDGAIRNQPWCRGCRGAATPKKTPVQDVGAVPLSLAVPPQDAAPEATPAAAPESAGDLPASG